MGAQCFAGHICFFIYLAPGCGQDPVALRTRIAFGFFHHLGFAFFRSTDNLLSLFLGLAGYLFRMLLRLRFGLLPFLSRREPISDLGLAIVQSCDDRRPDQLHAEPDENDESQTLADQRQVDVHSRYLIGFVFSRRRQQT